jgi:excinuclease Cho
MRTHVNSLGLLIHGDPVIPFIYPDHIDRASLDALPSRPGIYIFRDDDGEALYVGKSVNIRQRVLSHLRTAEEGRLLQDSRRVDFECTGGEIGALLRESQLIKQLQPPFNQKLRGVREMCALRMAGDLPEVVFSSEVDFARTPGLFGLFGTRAAAMETLRDVADRAGLCCAALGLERVARGRPCFARQLKRCAGVCVGAESAQAHGARILAALEPLHIAPWPFAGAVGIVEQAHGVRQVHVVDHWCYLGPRGKGRRRSKAAPQFDFDVYQILVRPLSQGGLTLALP